MLRKRIGRPDQIGKVVTVLLTPEPLPDLLLGRSALELSNVEKKRSTPSKKIEIVGGDGALHTKAEQEPGAMGMLAASTGKRMLLAVALSVLTLRPSTLMAQRDRWEELNERIATLKDEGKHAEAEAAAQEAVRFAERTYGPSHPRLASSLGTLADLYADQRRYADAEPIARRELAIMEHAVWRDDLVLSLPLARLARLCDAQGKIADADGLYDRVLAIVEKEEDPEHPDVDAIVSLLAKRYESQGRLAEAEPLRSGGSRAAP